MNVSELKFCGCGIFCWFACLSLCGCQSQVTKRLVFFPPNPPSYSLTGRADHLTLVPRDVNNNIPEIDGIHVSFTRVRTRLSSSLAVMFVRCTPPGQDQPVSTTLLYSHGNATDLGHVRGHLIDVARRMRVNVCAYDYSGYGASTGEVSVDNVGADIEAVFQYLQHEHADRCRCLILYGQSLGSAASLYLATAEPPSCCVTCKAYSCVKACGSCCSCCCEDSTTTQRQAIPQSQQSPPAAVQRRDLHRFVTDRVHGIVLHSPFMSGLRVLSHQPVTPWYDIFPNLDLIEKVS